MERETFALLKADIDGQMALIEDVFTKLDQRAATIEPEDEIRLESTAYQLHNLYNAIEDLLNIVAGYFENRIGDTAMPIDYEQLASNVNRAQRLQPLLERDVTSFVEHLSPDAPQDG